MAERWQQALLALVMLGGLAGVAYAGIMFDAPLKIVAGSAGFVGVIATLAGGIASSRSESTGPVKVQADGRSHLDNRIAEVDNAISRSRQVERWNRFSSGSLTFAQYVVGGALATSFIQESLSRQVVGLLGVVVVAASIMHQRYRPDVRFRVARYRRFRLERLLREVQDERFAIESRREGAPSEYKLVRMLTRGLAEADAAEIEEMDAFGEAKECTSGRERAVPLGGEQGSN